MDSPKDRICCLADLGGVAGQPAGLDVIYYAGSRRRAACGLPPQVVKRIRDEGVGQPAHSDLGCAQVFARAGRREPLNVGRNRIPPGCSRVEA